MLTDLHCPSGVLTIDTNHTFDDTPFRVRALAAYLNSGPDVGHTWLSPGLRALVDSNPTFVLHLALRELAALRLVYERLQNPNPISLSRNPDPFFCYILMG